jgi:acetyl-CoA acetyltransferase
VSGLGQSEVGRRLFRPSLDLTLDASLAAIADAGLTLGDIDGLVAYPGGGGPVFGFPGPSLAEVHDALRLRLSWYGSGSEVPGQLAAVIQACLAIVSGLARHVLVYRTVTEGSARAQARAAAAPDEGVAANRQPSPRPRASGWMQWLAPFGVTAPAQWYAPYVRRYMHDYGLTRAQLAEISISARTKAALNPKAVYRDPLTLDEYLASRMISDPICLYDCDVPCDGSTALILSSAEHASDAPHGTVRVESVGAGLGSRTYRDQFRDPWFGAVAAEQMWARTDIKPDDVDVAELYDGFSFLTLQWLESLGFCGRGEAGAFLEGGQGIALDGKLPLNTDGGQLAAGRLHGLGLVHEACLQLRGEAGERQVAGAEIAVVANSGVPNMGCMLLTRVR